MVNIPKMVTELRKISSDQAADWVLLNYPLTNPDYWIGLELISHLSWKRSDQVRLAQHYLKRLPFASAKPYEIFASFMSLGIFLRTIHENLPEAKHDKELLLYHLSPILHKVGKSNADHAIIQKFIADLAE